MHQNRLKRDGFTIVELLVVIVVIGVLAAVVVVAYAGISQKAAVAALQSDLKNASTRLNLDYVTNGIYPATMAAADNGNGLPKSTGTVYTYTSSGNSYCLSATSTTAGSSYLVMSSDGTIASGACVLSWKQVVAGASHSCAISYNDKVYCWGLNSNGQLGNNSITSSSVPVAVDMTGVLSGKTVKSLAGGRNRTCAIASDNLPYCWGENAAGQLGNNSTTESHVPVAVTTTGALSGKTVKSIAASYDGTCVIASDDNAYCWGQNTYGQLGNNSTTDSWVPVAMYTSGVLSGKTIKAMAGGSAHMCAIASDNLPYCWGLGTLGRLGNNSTVQSNVAVAVVTTGVLSGKTVKAVSAGFYHGCVIASDNLPYCWGADTNGQLGNNSTTESDVPVAVTTTGALSGKTVTAIASYASQNCVIASDSQIYCWGQNHKGQLGNNSTTQSLVPVAIYTSGLLNGKTAQTITMGAIHTCTFASDNQIYCWGYNANGALGNNSLVDSLVPVAAGSPPA